jgi:hypothetical protein
MTSVGTPLVWGVFALVVVVALAVDLGLFHRQARELAHARVRRVGRRLGAARGAFNAYVFQRFGTAKGLEFTQGYLLELPCRPTTFSSFFSSSPTSGSRAPISTGFCFGASWGRC